MPSCISRQRSTSTKRLVIRLVNPRRPCRRTVNLAWLRYPSCSGPGIVSATVYAVELGVCETRAARTESAFRASW